MPNIESLHSEISPRLLTVRKCCRGCTRINLCFTAHIVLSEFLHALHGLFVPHIYREKSRIEIQGISCLECTEAKRFGREHQVLIVTN